MNKINFNSLSCYKAPQAWLDKAAVIPEQPQKKRIFPLYRFAAVASIVLVSVTGLLIFLSFGGSKPVGVRNSPIDSETSQAGRTDEMGNPEIGTAEAPGAPATDANGDPVIGSEDASTSAQGKKKTSATEPTATSTQPIGAQLPSSAPTAVRNSTEKSAPTAPVTERAVTPTEAQKETRPPQPTSPPATQKPTDHKIYATVRIPDSPDVAEVPSMEDQAEIFCCLYDASGTIVGSRYLNAWEKAAEVLSVNEDGSRNVVYDPVEKGLHLKSGRYEFVFYDLYGTELYRGTVDY